MVKTDYNLSKFFVAVAVIVGVLLVVSFLARSFVRGRAEVNKFLFTEDASNIVRKTNPWRMSEELSFVLSPYVSTLQGIADLYIKIAQGDGWQIDPGSTTAANEHKRRMEFVGGEQDLIINLERIDFGKIQITIIYDR